MPPDFNLTDEIPIDRGHTLDQLTSRFQSIKDGLPELPKNSKDQYSRLGIRAPAQRQIVLLADSHQKRITVLDFAGAAAAEFKGWTTWSSRIASRANMAEDIEGGHGNGGKAFMVRGSTATSYMESCFKGRRTVMGFRNRREADRYKPGYLRENGLEVRDVAEAFPARRLATTLSKFGLRLTDLPTACQAEFERRHAFTVVMVDGIREWQDRRRALGRLVDTLPKTLAEHGQIAVTLETCQVWVFGNGTLLTDKPLQPQELEPQAGFDEPSEFQVPSSLEGVSTEDEVATGSDGKADLLRLRTSARNLRLTEDLRARNVIRVSNGRNVVASWTVPSLGELPATSSFIYGELRLASLTGDHLADSHRTDLAGTPLARAVKEWAYNHVRALAAEIQKKTLREHKAEDKDKAQTTLGDLRDLMREFLQPDDFVGDLPGHTVGGKGTEPGTRPRGKREPSERAPSLDEIVLEPTTDVIQIARGTRIPLSFRCYGHDDDGIRRVVSGARLALRTDSGSFCSLDAEAFLVGDSNGIGMVWLTAESGTVRSNNILVEVFSASAASIEVPEQELLQGQRIRLSVSLEAAEGLRDEAFIEAKVVESGMGMIGRHGFFTAGNRPGLATVQVRYGPGDSDLEETPVRVGSGSVPGNSSGEGGGNIPMILICGSEAPGFDDYEPDARTHPGGEAYPTIVEEPQFPNVVWINPDSKESDRVRRSAGSSTGVSSIGTKTYMQFLALKCFDVLKRLKVRQEIGGESVTEVEFRDYFAQAEVDCAKFVDAAYDLSERLAGKDQS